MGSGVCGTVEDTKLSGNRAGFIIGSNFMTSVRYQWPLVAHALKSVKLQIVRSKGTSERRANDDAGTNIPIPIY